MEPSTFAEVTSDRYRKPTRRERFLDEMHRVVPWAELAAAIAPVYPKPEGAGRPPVGVERMRRLHCLQQWFNLSDPAVEEALYDSRAMRHFVGIDLGREPVPDETTICKCRPLLEAHQVKTAPQNASIARCESAIRSLSAVRWSCPQKLMRPTVCRTAGVAI